MPINYGPSPSNYRNALPFNLFMTLQGRFPQSAQESDANWLKRIGRESIVWNTEFREELAGVLYRKRLDQAGLTRVEEIDSDGTGGTRRDFRGKSYNVRDLAETRQEQLKQARQYVTGLHSKTHLPLPGDIEQDKAAFDKLVQQFDGRTPPNGSIFWNGVSATKLAQCVGEWNRLGADVGQLEATTSFRWANGHFVYKWGNAFATLTEKVSAKLGDAARGHVTAVVMCGLRDNSVLTETEFPKILQRMTGELKGRGGLPQVTDISLVILEPKHSPLPFEILTNNAITRAKIIRGSPINSRDDCMVVGDFESGKDLKIPWQVKDYWARRPNAPSVASQRITADFSKFYYGVQGLWANEPGEIVRG